MIDNVVCTGCGACTDICPQKCISKVEKEGFLHPEVNHEKCVNCELCTRVCPELNGKKAYPLKAYIGVNKSQDVVFSSSSGGVFSSVCELLEKEGYCIFGVRFDDRFHATFDHTSNCSWQLFKKSKYIQSETKDVFSSVKKMLKEGKKVLFTGTPCQVSALKNYVGDHQNLLLIDIVCHGVAPAVCLEREIAYLQKKYKSKVMKFAFKNKKKYRGRVNSRTAIAELENGTEKILTINNDPFIRGYYARLFYRKSCMECKYACPERVGDITLGDAWHCDELYPQMNPLKGVSLILVNTGKGQEIINRLEDIEIVEIDREWAVKHNEQLRKPTSSHANRDRFFEALETTPFDQLVFQLVPVTIPERMKAYLRDVYYLVKDIKEK